MDEYIPKQKSKYVDEIIYQHIRLAVISLAATGGANMDQPIEIKIDVIEENRCHF